jgi:hypothetical protein
VKLELVVKIMVSGMFFNLIWYGFTNYVYGWPYPYNTFLMDPRIRFSDLAESSMVSGQDNPYLFPQAFYLPFTWVFLRMFGGMDDSLRTALCFSIFVGMLLVLMAKVLQPVVLKPWRCAFLSLLLIVLSYPMLACFDRGNTEIVLTALVAGSLYFYSQSKPLPALLCLVLAISFKVYPLVLLVLVARRNPKWALGGLLAAGILISVGLWELSLAPRTFYDFYARDMAFYNDYFVYQNIVLLSASPWNAVKLLLIIATKCHLIAPVDFSFDAPFIRNVYVVYSAAMLLLAAGVTFYAGLLEKEWMRGAMVLLLFLSILAPGGGDYRMIYAGMAIVLLVVTKTRRSHDTAILILLALTQVPKKLIIFAFAGLTVDGNADVSSEVLLDPILLLGALFLMLYSSRTHVDLHWTWLRFRKMIRQSITGWSSVGLSILSKPQSPVASRL